MHNNNQAYRLSNKVQEPSFLRERMDAFYEERVRKNWGGGNILRGRFPDANSIRLMSNDYLSLADHPQIVQAQADAMLSIGNGQLMSALFMHADTSYHALERRLASFLDAESAILCQSGWCANTGLIQSIAAEDVPVYIDINAHMSLWEGIRSAGARARPFRHNDADHLEHLIRRNGVGVVVVDSVYSTNGSVCPLKDVVDVGTRYGCILVVDESHSLGTHGPEGKGLVAALGLTEQVHFRTASLAKAFSARAGVITCRAEFCDYFAFTARPAIFSSALLPHEIAGLSATLDVIRRDEWRRQRLHRNAEVLRCGLLEFGYNVTDSQSQIIALEAGPEPQTIILRNALESRGLFGSAFGAPATAMNRSLIRFSLNAGLGHAELARILRICEEVRDEINIASWPSTRRLRRTRRQPQSRLGPRDVRIHQERSDDLRRAPA
jgi:CAI-1 autoinducer synthase